MRSLIFFIFLNPLAYGLDCSDPVNVKECQATEARIDKDCENCKVGRLQKNARDVIDVTKASWTLLTPPRGKPKCYFLNGEPYLADPAYGNAEWMEKNGLLTVGECK